MFSRAQAHSKVLCREGGGGGGGGGGGAKHDQNLNVMIAVLYPFDSSSEFSRGF